MYVSYGFVSVFGFCFTFDLRLFHAQSSQKEINEEERQRAYRKTHRSVPFDVFLQSSDITVSCKREDKVVVNEVFDLYMFTCSL